MNIQLHFYKTTAGLKGDDVGFIHELFLNSLPKDGEIFEYTETLFSQMNSKAQTQFTRQFGFSTGSYLVNGIIDYQNSQTNVDYSVFLIQDY